MTEARWLMEESGEREVAGGIETDSEVRRAVGS